MEALEMLNDLVDESDPDTDLPNIVHAFQTAERIREDHPDKEWFQLVGLIHDLGKVMAFYGEPQWCVVGDTFPVGCKPGQSVVFVEDSFLGNPDLEDGRYNTELGMYQPGCGIENLLMSWGHYQHLEADTDTEILDWVKEFNKYDLYTKSAIVPEIEKLKPYYQSLIDKYLPGVVDF